DAGRTARQQKPPDERVPPDESEDDKQRQGPRGPFSAREFTLRAIAHRALHSWMPWRQGIRPTQRGQGAQSRFLIQFVLEQLRETWRHGCGDPLPLAAKQTAQSF